MKNLLRIAIPFLVSATLGLAASTVESSIKQVLNVQVDAWNKADISTFVTTYAENCLFVGKQVVRGRQAVQDRYQKTYSNPAAMGKLEFTDLEVHQLDTDVALVIGQFHLTRTADGGGNSQGVFSLVFQKIAGKWQIVLDHTS